MLRLLESQGVFARGFTTHVNHPTLVGISFQAAGGYRMVKD